MIAKLKKNVISILIIGIATSLLIATAFINNEGTSANRQRIGKENPVAQEKTAIIPIPNSTIFLLISAGLIGLLGISRSRKKRE